MGQYSRLQVFKSSVCLRLPVSVSLTPQKFLSPFEINKMAYIFITKCQWFHRSSLHYACMVYNITSFLFLVIYKVFLRVARTTGDLGLAHKPLVTNSTRFNYMVTHLST